MRGQEQRLAANKYHCGGDYSRDMPVAMEWSEEGMNIDTCMPITICYCHIEVSP